MLRSVNEKSKVAEPKYGKENTGGNFRHYLRSSILLMYTKPKMENSTRASTKQKGKVMTVV